MFFKKSKEEKQIKQIIEKMKSEFQRIFGTDCIITTKKNADELIKRFIEYIKTDNQEYLENIQNLIIEPDKLEFNLDIKKDTENVDVGILIDPILGVFEVYNYGIFRKIFLTKDYQKIKNYRDCVNMFFAAENIPPGAILRVYEETDDKERFLKIVQESLFLGEKPDLDQLLRKYKFPYYEMPEKIIPKRVLEIVNPEAAKKQSKEKVKHIERKIGRNEPCPCGSGKKYKKCCLIDS